MNIKMSYLYRDAGNFKSYGFVVFSNPTYQSAIELEASFRSALTDGAYFVADAFLLPDLRPATLDDDLDHAWHELESIEETPASPTDSYKRAIGTLLNAALKSSPGLL